VKVFNLACEHGHAFEGWFASGDDFESQQARGLMRCPSCDSAVVRKLPAAPHLNFNNSPEPRSPQRTAAAPSAPAPAPAELTPAQAEARALVLQTLHKLITESEDVGERFAEVARKIHYGEDEQRSIRGVASVEERHALEDEGIDIISFPVPGGIKETLQ
jgi:hypothetical protein